MTPLTDSRPSLIWWICLGAIALVLANAARTWPETAALLIATDNDDLMRLVQVRDWLGGQDWFDTRQYRVLPPEGISMHWSRYVDAGIAAVLVPASWLLPVPQAELLTVVVWPSLLACLMVLLIGLGTNRLFGPLAALGALVVFFTWGKLRGEFTPPRIDHHNVQILCGTALFFLAALPGRDLLRGVLAGAVTALSLAVGLEMLPILALVPGYMAMRHAFDQPGGGAWLLGYGGALAVTAPALMAGQVPPAAWGTMYCDVLGPPVLALAATGIVATLVPVLAARVLKGPVFRILAMVVVLAASLWLAAPLLTPCLGGPFANVPPGVRTLIESRIIEALSVSELIGIMPAMLGKTLLPPVAILLLAVAALLPLWRRLDGAQRSALVLAFLIAFAGLGITLLQIRAATLMVPGLPLLAGFLVHAFQQIPRSSALRLPALLVLAAATPTAVEEGVAYALNRAPTAPATAEAQTLPRSPANCRTPAAMAELADLPPSTLFAALNLGTTLLAYTPHAVVAAPYHRSSDAFWNGIAGLETETEMRRALVTSRAEYVVLCAGDTSKPFAAAVLGGAVPDWLTDITGDRQALRVYQVDPARLAAAP